MISSEDRGSSSEAPLYIRWGPDRSPYAIELKLDLVERLRLALVEAGSRGQEIGGVLIGSLPTLQVPTLRIEDVDFLPRNAEDGPTFMLEGGGGERFAEVRSRARAKERSTVGLFRSHVRSGPLRPALADRTLLAGEFKEPVYVLFLANGAEPFSAAFFVASNGPLPAEVSVREFKLNPADFRALPEIELDVPGATVQASRPSRRSRLGGLAAALLLIFSVAGVLYYFNESVFSAFLPSSTSLGLLVRPQDGLVQITWNHVYRELDGAKGATLVIRFPDGEQRSIHLGVDELRLGTVCYDGGTAPAEVTLALIDASNRSKTPMVWRP